MKMKLKKILKSDQTLVIFGMLLLLGNAFLVDTIIYSTVLITMNNLHLYENKIFVIGICMALIILSVCASLQPLLLSRKLKKHKLENKNLTI
ncbi:hypothetical protein OPB01_002555 [Salmonella enterica]|nr:hypothetical protein [Salmonella enterica]